MRMTSENQGTEDRRGSALLVKRQYEDASAATKATNASLNPRRWQPRPALRDDLPLFGVAPDVEDRS